MGRIEKLKELLEKDEDDSFISHALALEYLKSGENEKARILLTKLLEKDENYIGSYYHLARLLEKTGGREEAIKYYQKGMSIAKKLNDQHSFNELQNAYEELIDI